MFKTFAFVFAFLCSLNARAFIPASDYIIEKAVKNAGTGLFYIEQEVVFKSDVETLPVKEMWTIQDADTMRLVIKANSLSATYVYSGGKVYTMESAGDITSKRVSPENLDRFHHARSEKTLSHLLMSAKIVSADPLRPRPRPKTVGQIKVENDPFVRLSRIEKDPVLLLSYTSEPNESASAGIWFDQETYAIRKIRFPNQAEDLVIQNASLSKDLVFPKLRTVNWSNNSVEIRLLKANSISKSKDTEQAFSTSSMTSPNQWGSSNLSSQIKEFYQRFR